MTIVIHFVFSYLLALSIYLYLFVADGAFIQQFENFICYTIENAGLSSLLNDNVLRINILADYS